MTDSVVVPRWAASAAVSPRFCDACIGHSAPWDGHDLHPTPCAGAGHEALKEALKEPDPRYVAVRRDDLAAALGDAQHMLEEYGACGTDVSYVDRLRAALGLPTSNR